MSFIKFGVSYNVFDGEELLKDSILSIREFIQYISVVYQKKSNYGNDCAEDLVDLLFDLKDEGLVDEIVEFVPQYFGERYCHNNELLKRNIGLELSRKNYCTHHMSMDTDEFYVKEEFQNLVDFLKKNQNIATYCGLVNYYKTPEYLLNYNDDTKVSLLFPIKDKNVTYKMGYVNAPHIVDPTRRPFYDKYHLFDSDFIVMHHMTMVRKNIQAKLLNSSARINFDRGNHIQEIIDYYNNWNGENLIGKTVRGNVELLKIVPKFSLYNYNNY
jgi:hypothetical protein